MNKQLRINLKLNRLKLSSYEDIGVQNGKTQGSGKLLSWVPRTSPGTPIVPSPLVLMFPQPLPSPNTGLPLSLIRKPEFWISDVSSLPVLDSLYKHSDLKYPCKYFLFLITWYQFANRVMISVTFQEIMFNILY